MDAAEDFTEPPNFRSQFGAVFRDGSREPMKPRNSARTSLETLRWKPAN